MDNYKILAEGKNDKVLVEWQRDNGIEYSVHTKGSYEGSLIWGHYFSELEDAKEYFVKAQNR